MKINNKGFTLIELLGVIVVLAAILLIAIPNLSSTLERNKNKIDDNKRKNIISAAEIDFSNNNCNYTDSCVISINCLLTKNLLTKDELISSNGKDNFLNNVVAYNINGKKKFELFKETEIDSNLNNCCNCR